MTHPVKKGAFEECFDAVAMTDSDFKDLQTRVGQSSDLPAPLMNCLYLKQSTLGPSGQLGVFLKKDHNQQLPLDLPIRGIAFLSSDVPNTRLRKGKYVYTGYCLKTSQSEALLPTVGVRARERSGRSQHSNMTVEDVVLDSRQRVFLEARGFAGTISNGIKRKNGEH